MTDNASFTDANGRQVKTGDRVQYLDGRNGTMQAIFQDGSGYVRFDGDAGDTDVNWYHVAKWPDPMTDLPTLDEAVRRTIRAGLLGPYGPLTVEATIVIRREYLRMMVMQGKLWFDETHTIPGWQQYYDLSEPITYGGCFGAETHTIPESQNPADNYTVIPAKEKKPDEKDLNRWDDEAPFHPPPKDEK